MSMIILVMKSKNGFSLIELLVVISIIGVLAAILMVNLMGARERGRDSQRIQDLNSLKGALRLYYNDNQSYPSGSGCTTSGVAGVGYTYTVVDSNNGFLLTVGLESGAGNDDINSQVKCGVATPRDKVYAVCAY
jgi:prepilin-type N-terminal cleavage/methylation domain-containing protein